MALITMRFGRNIPGGNGGENGGNGGTAQQQLSPIGASPWRNEEVKSNIYLHTDYRLSTDFVYYLPQISGIVAPILSA